MPTRPNDAGSPFVRAALQTYGANVAGAILSLASVLIVARTLGAEGRGSVAFLTALTWFTASVSTLGVQEANANLAAREPSSRRALAGNSAVLSVAFGAVAAAVLAGLIAVVPALGGGSDLLLRWVAFAFLPVLILQTCLRMLVQADYAFAVTNVAYLAGPVLNVGLNGLFAVAGVLTVASAVGVWLAGQAIGTAVLVWHVLRRQAGFGRPDPALARRTLAFGSRAHVGRVMQLGNYRLDQVLLGAIAGPRELGLYSIAVAWAEALWFLPTTLASVQRPDLVRARDARAAARQAARAFRAIALVTLGSGLVMAALAPFLCATVFGREFEGSVDDLRVLVAGAFGMVALKLFGNALVARGHPGLQSLSTGVGFALTVVLDLLLIPSLGGLGAALASVAAYTVAGALVVTISARVLGGRARDLVPRARDVGWFVDAGRRLAGRGRTRGESQPGGPPP